MFEWDHQAMTYELPKPTFNLMIPTELHSYAMGNLGSRFSWIFPKAYPWDTQKYGLGHDEACGCSVLEPSPTQNTQSQSRAEAASLTESAPCVLAHLIKTK